MDNPTGTDISAETAPAPAPAPRTGFLVVGVGRAGGAIAELLAAAGLDGARFAAVDTDSTALGRLQRTENTAIGARLTRGEGCGNDLARGAQSAEQDIARLRKVVEGVRLVCIVAGIGGGIGGGAAAVVARVAREAGSLVLGIAVLPFRYEGPLRHSNASEGLQALRAASDAVICVPNQGVAAMLDERTLVTEVFDAANVMVAQSVESLWRLLHRPSMNPLGFADLERLLRGRHAESVFAAVETRGPARAREAVEKLRTHPFLQAEQMLVDADAALLAIAGGNDLRFDELQEVQDQFQRLCEHAQVVTGSAVDPALEGRIVVTVIATRGGASPLAAPQTAMPAQTKTHPANEASAPSDEPPMRFESIAGDDLPTNRSGSKFIPPAPDLTDSQKRDLVHRQIKNKHQRKKTTQTLFNFEVVSVSRFAQTEPVKRNGENLDEPTYARRGVALN